MLRGRSRWVGVAAIATAVGVVFGSGCASQPKLSSLTADPTLTYRDMQQGKVALMPVAASARTVPLDELSALDATLEVAFDRNAHGLARVPRAAVVHAIEADPENRDTILRVSDTGKADARALRRLGKAVGARYLLFTVADYIEVRDPSVEFQAMSETMTWSSEWAHGTDKFVTSSLRIQEPTTSELMATAALLDVDTKQVRWQGTHRVTRAVGNSVHVPRPSRLSWTLFSEITAALPSPD
jgi:hypothetical protein